MSVLIEPTNNESSTLHGSYGWTDTLKVVHYGPGSVKTALPKLLAQFGGKKALVVTGKSLREKTDVIQHIEAILKGHDAYAATFSDIGEHAPVAGIRAASDLYTQSGAGIIVSVGGGSPIDASKAIIYNLQQTHGGDFARQIAIPTTLSAAEYTVGAGFTNDDGVKAAVSSPELAPAGIILDAELTLSTPERLWLSTGLRALDHAVENLYRPLVPPPVKVLCYAALADLFKYLPESKKDPANISVRQKLQIASWMSLWPLKTERYSALGLSHALGHKLGAAYGIPHGITSCLTLAPTVALKAEIATAEDKEYLAGALFYLREQSTGSPEGDTKRLSSLIAQLVESLGLKSTLTQYKVPREDIPGIAEKALGGRPEPLYSRTVELLEGLY